MKQDHIILYVIIKNIAYNNTYMEVWLENTLSPRV